MSLRLLGDFHQLSERGGVVHGQVSQHLAVDFDVLLLQTVDKGGIAHAAQAGGGVDTDDPQAAEVALAQFAAGVGVAQGAAHLFAGSAVLLGFASPVTLRQLEHLAAFLMGVDSPLNTCHSLLFLLMVGDGLLVGDQLADGGGFGVVLQAAAHAQVTDALGGLLVEDMVGVHFLVLHLAGLGQAKTLGGTAVGLLLGHG